MPQGKRRRAATLRWEKRGGGVGASKENLKSKTKSKAKSKAKMAAAAAAAANKMITPVGAVSCNNPYSFVVQVLGDLHINPRKMEDYNVGQEHVLRIVNNARDRLGLANGGDGGAASSSLVSCGMVIISLGDLGKSKNCNHM